MMNFNFIIGIILGALCIGGIILVIIYFNKKAEQLKATPKWAYVVLPLIIILGIVAAFFLIRGGMEASPVESSI